MANAGDMSARRRNSIWMVYIYILLIGCRQEAGMHVYKGEKPREEKEKRKERELVNVARDIFGRQTHISSWQEELIITSSKTH